MGGLKRTYRALTALCLAGLGAAATSMASAPGAGAAGIFGAEPLANDSTVALAQPVDGTRWNLVVVERLQAGNGCWQRQANGLVSLEPDALSNEAACNRLQSSSGYSLRAGDQDLSAPWRLRIEAVGNRLELQALNPSLPAPITIGIAPLPRRVDAAALPAFSLNPGWSFQKRSYEGRLLSHVYLSTPEPLGQLQARSRDQASEPVARNSLSNAAGLPPLASPLRNQEPQPGQVISLQVVPFRDETNLTALSQ